LGFVSSFTPRGIFHRHRGAGPDTAPRGGAVGPKMVIDKFVKGMSNFADLLDNKGGMKDVDALKTALGVSEFEAVKAAMGKITAKHREEVRMLKDQSLDQQKKLQRELNSYSNKLRDLEFQLIMAATEVTDLEEKLSAYEYDSAADPISNVRPVKPENHPVFGGLLADFGYKKVYAADPAKLYAGSPIYKKQRTFRTERASAIARAKTSSGVIGWPGTISVVELADTEARGSFVLVDGQHRLGAYTLLSSQIKRNQEEGVPLPPGMTEILVEVYPETSDEKAAEIFTEINKAEPCKLIDMPNQSGASPEVKAVIDAAAEALRDRHAEMFKPSDKCRTPHMNLDNLRDELYQSGVVERKGFKTRDELLWWMLEKNAQMGEVPDDEWVPKRRTRAASLPRALGKARANDFFLGVEWDWLNED